MVIDRDAVDVARDEAVRHGAGRDVVAERLDRDLHPREPLLRESLQGVRVVSWRGSTVAGPPGRPGHDGRHGAAAAEPAADHVEQLLRGHARRRLERHHDEVESTARLVAECVPRQRDARAERRVGDVAGPWAATPRSGQQHARRAAGERRRDREELFAPRGDHGDRRFASRGQATHTTDLRLQRLRHMSTQRTAQSRTERVGTVERVLDITHDDLPLLGVDPRFTPDVVARPRVKLRLCSARGRASPIAVGQRNRARRVGMLSVQRQRARIDGRAELQSRLDVQYLVLVHAGELRLKTTDRMQRLATDQQTADRRRISPARRAVDGREETRRIQDHHPRGLGQQQGEVGWGRHIGPLPGVPPPDRADDHVGVGERRGDANPVRVVGREKDVVAVEKRHVPPRRVLHPDVPRCAHAPVLVTGMVEVPDPRIAAQPTTLRSPCSRRSSRRRRG